MIMEIGYEAQRIPLLGTELLVAASGVKGPWTISTKKCRIKSLLFFSPCFDVNRKETGLLSKSGIVVWVSCCPCQCI